ncbi:MAG: manganese efflux pump MntP family protein [Coriobacteriales bacterium]|jgi:putative Mn2+ efflux pump MntP|nr:manganese efflux pump MntP family protein [Coriobacteriales bacterium]
MGILEIIVIGLGLSMDAFAVTIANVAAAAGAATRTEVAAAGTAPAAPKTVPRPPGTAPATQPPRKGLTFAQLLAMPLVFGLYQGLMPLVGSFAGSLIAGWVEAYAGIIALVILGLIGGKMVLGGVNALRHPDEATVEGAAQLSPATLAAQGLATSIDALVVGAGFAALGVPIALAAGLIALTTFFCCVLALLLGRRFGIILGEKAQVAGGIVLVLIGIRTCFFG